LKSLPEFRNSGIVTEEISNKKQEKFNKKKQKNKQTKKSEKNPQKKFK